MQYGQPVPSEISAVIRVDSSDVAASGANIFCSLLEGPEKRPLVLGNALKLEHSGAATIEAFAGNVAQIFARHRETVEGLGKIVPCVYQLSRECDGRAYEPCWNWQAADGPDCGTV